MEGMMDRKSKSVLSKSIFENLITALLSCSVLIFLPNMYMVIFVHLCLFSLWVLWKDKIYFQSHLEYMAELKNLPIDRTQLMLDQIDLLERLKSFGFNELYDWFVDKANIGEIKPKNTNVLRMILDNRNNENIDEVVSDFLQNLKDRETESDMDDVSFQVLRDKVSPSNHDHSK